MSKVTIRESKIDLGNGKTGKIAVFMYTGADDPVEKLDEAVANYVGHESHMQFVDVHMDNPWIRVITSDINQIKGKVFNPAKHQL